MDQIDQIERTPDAFEALDRASGLCRRALCCAACQGEVASCLGFSMGAQEHGSMPEKPSYMQASSIIPS